MPVLGLKILSMTVDSIGIPFTIVKLDKNMMKLEPKFNHQIEGPFSALFKEVIVFISQKFLTVDKPSFARACYGNSDFSVVPYKLTVLSIAEFDIEVSLLTKLE